MFRKIKKDNLMFGLGGVTIFLVIWEISARFRLVSPILISSPEAVVKSELELFTSKYIYPHLFQSLQEIVLGLSLAICFGVVLGLLIGRFSRLEKITHPLIYSLYSTPAIAIFPLLMMWLGFSIWTKVSIVFLASFFPIIINTISAVKNLDPNFVRLAKSFGANDFDIFKTITLPSSLPYILSGVRIAVPRGITGMVVGEFFASNLGLGHLISFYGGTFQTDNFLAVVLVVVILSVTCTSVLNSVEKRLQNWKPGRNDY